MDVIIQMIIAYLLGSIPSGVWIGQAFFNKDIRKYGSGNTGATNTFRILGPKGGTIALIADVLKGFVATFIPIYLGTDIHPVFIGIFAIIGHIYPIYIKFKGGKAVATTAGIFLAIQPVYVLIFIGVFLMILLTTSTVSIASMGTMVLAAIFSFLIKDPIMAITIWILALLIIYLHRENVARIKNGVESRVPFGLRSTKKDK
ncbi:MAG TPA: glycerol-3-phosphate 1-O-acyltransferase PlsY [Atopostipes sp.]|nr:glycerol-3-phosphate 1-O-acyltransferase PlsY [Atopostipes sp.]